MPTNQIYSLNPTQVTVTKSFSENVEKLKSMCIPTQHIIDIYIESQKYAKDIRSLTNPMRFIEARESETELSDIRFRQLERAYNDVVQNWSKLNPLQFMQQYEAYIANRPNNTGIENGIVSQIFFRFTTKENKTLIIDPTPSFIKQQQEFSKHLTYTYSDDRYFEVIRYSTEKDHVKEMRYLDKQFFDRVLYFARDNTPDEIQRILENIKSALIEQRSTGIYILMPTVYLEKRISKGELWNFLKDNYTIFKIVLMPQSAVQATRKKQCLLILQNKPEIKYQEILIQKTKLVDKDKIESLEFRRVPFDSFTKRERTLSEMYDTDYNDYSEPNRRQKPIEYKFTNEISIWVSFAQQDGKYRPYYSVYNYPTPDQARKNTLHRGKSIKTHIPGKWYDTKEEALASAEYVLQDKELAKIVRKAVIKEYLDKNKPVSLKTLLFVRLEQISGEKGFNEDIYNSVFFRPHSATDPICGFIPNIEETNGLMAVLSAYIKDNALSETKADLFMKQMVILFNYAVIERYYACNLVRKMLNSQGYARMQTSKMRREMVNRSFDAEQEAKFLTLLLNDSQNPEKALATLLRIYTGLPLNQLCALTRGDYIVDPDLNLSMIAVTKELQYRTTNVIPLPKEKQRLIPVVRPIADMINAKIKSQGRQSNNAPLFSKPGNNIEPLSPRQLRDYYNSIVDKLGIPEIKLSVDVERSSQATTDISDYKGDFLRCNFDFHARYDTKLETESINYLMGRKLQTTEGQYYCDYSAKLMQLLMRTQLDQWAARFFAANPDYSVTRIRPQNDMISYVVAPSNQHTRTRIELDIDPSCGGENASILLQIFARYGAALSIQFYPEEQEEDKDE